MPSGGLIRHPPAATLPATPAPYKCVTGTATAPAITAYNCSLNCSPRTLLQAGSTLTNFLFLEPTLQKLCDQQKQGIFLNRATFLASGTRTGAKERKK